jgi:PadR family transcriptional regulator PadR
MRSRTSEKDRAALLQGTLDLLIMRTLLLGPRHGQGISRSIQQQSEDVFLVDHGSLYLALQRLEERDYVRGEWGLSENNRRARFYKLTPKGKTQLTKKSEEWNRIARAIARILTPGPAEV